MRLMLKAFVKKILAPTTTITTLILGSKSIFFSLGKTLDCRWSRKSTQGSTTGANSLSLRTSGTHSAPGAVSLALWSCAGPCAYTGYSPVTSNIRLWRLRKAKATTHRGKNIARGLPGWENPYCFVRKSDGCWWDTMLSSWCPSCSLCQAQRACVRWWWGVEKRKGKHVVLNVLKCLLTDGGKTKCNFKEEEQRGEAELSTTITWLPSLFSCKCRTATPFLQAELFW